MKDNLVFDIQAHKYATVKAVLTVDNAANITAYEGQSYNNKVIILQNGSNNIELGEKNNLIQIKPNSGCKVESLKGKWKSRNSQLRWSIRDKINRRNDN